MYSALRQLLFQVPPEQAHDLALLALSSAGHLPGAAKFARDRARAARPALRTTVANLQFDNPLGLAAGFDKNGRALAALFGLGFGFLEVGTVTPRAQPGNPKPRIFRLPRHQALINRLGFNNDGMETMAGSLERARWRPGPVGINIGKNKDTPLTAAASDYQACAQRLSGSGDYLVVNLSSPNTPGLRQLQEPAALESLLKSVRGASSLPLFLKIAPDLSDPGVDAAVDVAMGCGLSGLICTNTTTSRPVEDPIAGEEGGLSGRPLFARSTDVLRRAFRRARGALSLIGVGGVMSGEDAWAKICAGASLVQVYTGFIYGGPRFPRRVLDTLEDRLSRVGLTSLASAVGRDT